MKGITEFVLVAVLLVLVYDKPTILTEFSNSILGKLMLIIAVCFVAKVHGLTAGLVAALIMLVLMHESLEGLATKDANCQPRKNGKTVSCLLDTDCGAAVTVCQGANVASKVRGKCMSKIMPQFETDDEIELAATNNKDIGTFDIRLQGGMNNQIANQNTIAAMKFQNGFTGNRETFQGFM